MKLKLIFVFLIVVGFTANAQIKSFGIGGFGGIGSIKGNSPSQTSFTASPFIEVTPSFLEYVSFRAAFFYSRKLEYLLPENRQGRYYPFVRGFNLKAVVNQKMSGNIFIEYGMGPLVLNDRTFSDVNVWTVGISAGTAVGLMLVENIKNSFSLSLGTEYGATFTQTSASYFSFHVQMNYSFL